ncbi:MAG: apolipoprotein N-acyltransferase [Agrococcus casei]|uniref:apolipoprotein N-acyltransferase n=1 Tax=Agrococcus casei TaxID=343512 RepID=UPI003F91EB80
MIERSTTRSGVTSKRRFRFDKPLPLPAALAVAAASGLLLTTAFQPLGWWPLVLVATIGELWALRGRTLKAALLVGAVSGAAFWFVHISWVTVYLGPVPLIALGLFMTIWRALGAMGIAFAYRVLEQRLSRGWQLLGVPFAVAAIMVMRETLSATVPWGGFSWGRLAFTQSGTIVGDAVSWTGVSGLSFLLMWLAALVVQLIVQRRMEARRRITVGAVAAIALVAVPAYPVQLDDSLRIGAVQGASEAGLLAPYTQGQIIEEHHEAAQQLEGTYDLVVLPENAGEFNPQQDPRASALISDIADDADAPVVVGAVTGTSEEYYNSAILWEPDGGPIDVYHKRHPVPFAEYLPARDFFEPILDAMGFLELIPRDYSTDPTMPNAFDTPGFTAGVAICFDIIDDALMREMVTEHGAQIILAPTNNADFGEGSAENVQQLAIAQMRAQELGRSTVNISTVGTSAMILPDGTVVEQLPQYEPGVMSHDLPTSSTITPAARFGSIVDWALPILGLLTLLTAMILNPKRGNRSV